MRRREFIAGLMITAATGRARRSRVKRRSRMLLSCPETTGGSRPGIRRRLQQLGWTGRHNVRIDIRWG
jgi:hypothetical protein